MLVTKETEETERGIQESVNNVRRKGQVAACKDVYEVQLSEVVLVPSFPAINRERDFVSGSARPASYVLLSNTKESRGKTNSTADRNLQTHYYCV